MRHSTTSADAEHWSNEELCSSPAVMTSILTVSLSRSSPTKRTSVQRPTSGAAFEAATVCPAGTIAGPAKAPKTTTAKTGKILTVCPPHDNVRSSIARRVRSISHDRWLYFHCPPWPTRNPAVVTGAAISSTGCGGMMRASIPTSAARWRHRESAVSLAPTALHAEPLHWANSPVRETTPTCCDCGRTVRTSSASRPRILES